MLIGQGFFNYPFLLGSPMFLRIGFFLYLCLNQKITLMANEITLINGVRKRRIGDSNRYIYSSGSTIVIANGDTNTYNYDGFAEKTEPIAFADITDKLGAADIIGYVDACCNAGFFFEPANVGGGNVKFISELSQLPTPSGGVIDLGDDGISYYFVDIVDAGGLTIDFGNNVVSGISQELAGLQNAVIQIDQTCTVKFFRFNSCSMTINAVGGAFDWLFVNFYDCSNIDIQNAANVIWETFGFINTYNVQITGTLDSLVLSPNCIFRSVTTEICDFFAVRSTAVINRRIRIQDSVFSTDFATQNPINVEVGASIAVESFILKVVRFVGPGSIVGINGDDDIASFRDCVGDGVVNSTSIANMYIQNNQTTTPTPVVGDKYKVVGTTLASSIIQRFTHDAINNTLEYTSSVSRIFRIQMPYTVFAGNNNIVGAYIAVTRAGDVEDPNTDVIAESEMYTTTNGARPISGAAQCIVTLNQGDKVYAAVENETQATNVRVEFLNMIVETANV